MRPTLRITIDLFDTVETAAKLATILHQYADGIHNPADRDYPLLPTFDGNAGAWTNADGIRADMRWTAFAPPQDEPTYSQPWGSREIYKDGEPFVTIASAYPSGEYNPADVDDFGRLVGSLLNAKGGL